MKRTVQLFVVLLLSFFLAACGDQDDNSNAADDNDNADTEDQAQDERDNDNDNEDEMENADSDSDQDMIDKMDELDYAEIEVEIDYGKDDEYEAEIEQDKDKGEIEAELEDEVKDNIDIKGKEAFDKIYPNVKKLTIDQDTSKEDAIDQTLEAFDLDSDYEEFEIEITFHDDTELEFEEEQ